MRNSKKLRRRTDWFDWIFRILFSALLLVCLAGLCKQCHDIEELQEKIGSTNLTIVAADTYLPEGFSAQSAGYQKALQRYDIEQGHVFPEENEKAAPESANSEAEDTESSAP